MIKKIYEAGKIYPIIETYKAENEMIKFGTPVMFVCFKDNNKAVVKNVNGDKFVIPSENLSEHEIKKYPNVFSILKSKINYHMDFLRSLSLVLMVIIEFAIWFGCNYYVTYYNILIALLANIVIAIIFFYSLRFSWWFYPDFSPDDDTWTLANKDYRSELKTLLNTPKFEFKDTNNNLIDICFSSFDGIYCNKIKKDQDFVIKEI